MTNFIFCLIFIQVSIFLIAGVLLLASLAYGFFEKEQAKILARPKQRRQKSRPEPLSKLEIEYLLGA